MKIRCPFRINMAQEKTAIKLFIYPLNDKIKETKINKRSRKSNFRKKI